MNKYIFIQILLFLYAMADSLATAELMEISDFGVPPGWNQ